MRLPTYVFLLNLLFFVNSANFDFTQIIAKTIIDILHNVEPNECTRQLELFSNGLTNMDMWAMKMFDASAKPQTGILTGNIMHIGNYEECLKIDETVNEKRIKGQYCTIMWTASEDYGQALNQLINNALFIQQTEIDAGTYLDTFKRSFGVCIPAVCKSDFLNNVTEKIEKALQLPVNLNFFEPFCKVDESKPADAGVIAALTIFSLFGVIVIASTLYDILVYQNTKDKNKQIFVAFSLYSNGKSLLKMKTPEDSLGCLNGIRVITMMWIVLGHRYMFMSLIPVVNAVDFLEWADTIENTLIFASTMGVDTFFIISGLLIVYVFLKHNEKGTRTSWPMFYLHRILRLTPSLAMVILFSSTLIDYFCTGPMCPVIYSYAQETCERDWWATLIYLQNYLHTDQCVGQAWYLAVDTQLYFLSPIILIPLIKFPKYTIIFSLFLCFLSLSYIFEVTWKRRLGSIFIDQSFEQFDYIYSQTHTRASVWIIGALCGYFIFQFRNKKLKLSKFKVVLLWGLALGIMLGVILSHIAFVRNEYNVASSAFFNILSKPAWACALCLIIILCVKGHGGIINKFLSCTLFNFLIRVNYNIYLLHMLVMIFMLMGQRMQGYFSNGAMFHQFWGDYMYSLVAAVLWTLAFESPVVVLEKIMFRKRDKNEDIVHVNNNNNNIPTVFNNRVGEAAENHYKIKISSYNKINEFL